MQIELTKKEVEYVLACVAERPLRESLGVWTKIQRQQQANAEASKPPDAPES